MSGVGANDRDVMLGEIELALPPLAVHVVSIWDGRTDGRQNSMVALGRSITLVDKVLLELWAHSAKASLLQREDTDLHLT